MIRVYLDANVFIAFILQESGGLTKLMYQDVEDFFAECHNRYVLVISDHTLAEINKVVHYSKGDVFDFLIKEKLDFEYVETKENDVKLSQELCKRGIHQTDALHAAIALNQNCAHIVTFNIKDFEKIREIKVKEPAELF